MYSGLSCSPAQALNPLAEPRPCALPADRQCAHWQNVLPLKETAQEAAALRRPARSEREESEKTAFFSRNDRAHHLKLQAFQTKNA